MYEDNHYKYLEKVLPTFFNEVGVRGGWSWNAGIIVAHGDKGYGYRYAWGKEGIPFNRGMAIFLLTYTYPFGQECRNYVDGEWVNGDTWVVRNYDKFKDTLERIEGEVL